MKKLILLAAVVMIAGCAKQGKYPIHDPATVANSGPKALNTSGDNYSDPIHPQVEWPTFACPRSANCTAGPIDSVAFGRRGIFAYHVGGNGKAGRWLNEFGYSLTEADIHRAVDPK